MVYWTKGGELGGTARFAIFFSGGKGAEYFRRGKVAASVAAYSVYPAAGYGTGAWKTASHSRDKGIPKGDAHGGGDAPAQARRRNFVPCASHGG